MKAERATRYQTVAALCAAKFGVDVARYPRHYVEPLLSSLPDVISVEDADLLRRIISVCSIGETVFMRHPEHFAALAREAPELKAIAAKEGRPLFVWSAGCATGEEAYSLAAALSSDPEGVRVLGTDVNPSAIERAKAGRYRLWSMRGADPQAVSSWLSLDALQATVRPEVRRLVDFAVQNLVGDAYPTGVDIIFCRNVLLYFCEEAAEAVLARFWESLRPGGLLFLGYLDPAPAEGGDFTEVHVGGMRYFRKPRRAPTQALSSDQKAPPPPSARVSRAPSPPAADPRLRLEDTLSMARSLCGQGASEEALHLLQDVCAELPLEVEPYVLEAMIAEEAGRLTRAVAAARRAHFLAPEEPVCRYLFGVCLDRLGARLYAERILSQARSALDAIEDLRLPLSYGGGLTGFQMQRMIDARLA